MLAAFLDLNPRKVFMLKNPILILLVGLITSAGILGATEPVALDFSKPIQVDLWSGPPLKDAATKAGVDQKTMGDIMRSEPSRAYSFPMLIGCVLAGGEIRRPFAVPYQQPCATDNGLYLGGGNCMYRYFLIPWEKEALLDFSCKLEGATIHGRSKSDYGGPEPIEVEWNAKVDDDKIVGILSMILKDGKRLERPLIGLLRNTDNVGLDPMNAIYQFERNVQPNDWKSSHTIVVEVANGKSVAAMAYRRGGKLVEVDATGMTVTPQPVTVTGRSAIVGGTLVVGGKSMILESFLMNPNGFVLKETPRPSWNGMGGVRTRAYSNTDPVARRWKEWMTATFTGPMVLPDDMSALVARETTELEVLPSPGPATAFTHYHLTKGDGNWHFTLSNGMGNFLYPPWFNFQPVEGADHYQFRVLTKDDYRMKRMEKGHVFSASSPTASLRPVWKDVIPGDHVAMCTAIDASGRGMGEPKTWNFQKKLSFGEGKNLCMPIPDPMATQLALRFPRTLANHHYAYFPFFEHVRNAAISPSIEPSIVLSHLSYSMRDPNRCLLKWSDQASELAAATIGEHYYWWNLQNEPDPMGVSFSYRGQYYSTFQDWAKQVMDSVEATGQHDRLATIKMVFANIGRIQQPSGSWTFTRAEGGTENPNIWPEWKGGFTLFKNAWLDHNAGPYTLGYGRYRRLSGDSQFLDAELKANHWLARNALRTGWWESQTQNGDGHNNRPTIPIHAQDYILYLLEHAPAQIADLSLAEDLAHFLEDQFVEWDTPVPTMGGVTLPCSDDGHLRMAITWLHLYRKTGKPLYFAKAEAFFTSYMQQREPVEGLKTIRFSRLTCQQDEPWNALRYLELRRQIQKETSTMPDAANSPMVVTLYNAAEGRERVVLYLDCQGGKVVRAVATTPTWHQTDIPFTQPGRVHHHEQTVFYHKANADKITVGAGGIQGEVTILLTPPILGAPTASTTFILDAQPDARVLRGAWSSGKATGRISGEIRGPAKDQPKRFNLEIGKAVAGGEAWQNWALAQFDLKDPKSATLSNNNAGWRATVDSSNQTLSRDAMTATMKVTVTWRGFMDNTWNPDKAAKEDRKAEWKIGTLDWLAYWRIGHEGNSFREETFEPGFRPLPWPEHTRSPGKMVGDTIPKPWPKDTPIFEMEADGGRLEYKTSFKPIVPGTCEYQFEGTRVGDVIAGTVTVKSPDGKESVCQCFGSLE
ncbi:hypothetical protein LBMAG53_20600 [Planctomycetota bacterium]|nr:hypothetical protein LBMAG53_20600 [Planctomycetota bacterium]